MTIQKIESGLFLIKGVTPINDLTVGIMGANFRNRHFSFDAQTFTLPRALGSKDIYLMLNDSAKSHDDLALVLKARGFVFCKNAPNFLLGIPFKEVLPVIATVKVRKLTAAGADAIVKRSDGKTFFLETRIGGHQFDIGLKNVSKKKTGLIVQYQQGEMILAERT